MGGTASILVIDDEPTNFDVIETLLLVDGENYQFNYAASGRKAISRLDITQPDVILLDVMMPDMDGIEVCRQIKAHPVWGHVPIIMVTALTAKADLARCIAAGADDFISKPVNGEELRARTRSMLRIKQQYDSLKTMMRLREDMSNMMVHDLRSPISCVLVACELLLKRSLLKDKDLQQVQQIHHAMHRLNRMIDDLLMMAKMEASGLLLNRTDVDLNRLTLEEVLPEFEAMSHSKQIVLSTDLPETGCCASLDKSLIQRLIGNLLSNAIKFSPAQSKILLRILSLPTDSCHRIRIQVLDQGPGVREELRDRIFNRFETGDPIGEASQIGLGLTFCKMVAEAHGGHIFVEPNLPQGSIFTVEI